LGQSLGKRNSATPNCLRQQATGNRQQATGNRQQATGNYTHLLDIRVNPLLEHVSIQIVFPLILQSPPVFPASEYRPIVRLFYISLSGEIKEEQ
jgi:hypothetical protein